MDWRHWKIELGTLENEIWGQWKKVFKILENGIENIGKFYLGTLENSIENCIGKLKYWLQAKQRLNNNSF